MHPLRPNPSASNARIAAGDAFTASSAHGPTRIRFPHLKKSRLHPPVPQDLVLTCRSRCAHKRGPAPIQGASMPSATQPPHTHPSSASKDISNGHISTYTFFDILKTPRITRKTLIFAHIPFTTALFPFTSARNSFTCARIKSTAAPSFRHDLLWVPAPACEPFPENRISFLKIVKNQRAKMRKPLMKRGFPTLGD